MRRVLLLLERAGFTIDVLDQAFDILDGRRLAGLRQADARAGGIEHADRLVRQLTAADVAVRQADRFGHRLVQHADAEVLLHQRHHAPQENVHLAVVGEAFQHPGADEPVVGVVEYDVCAQARFECDSPFLCCNPVSRG